jgi:hypothetical protein
LLRHEAQQELAALIAETQRIMRSPNFDRNLRAVEAEFGKIAQSAFGRRLPAAAVADILAGRDVRYRFWPARVQWMAGKYSTTDASGPHQPDPYRKGELAGSRAAPASLRDQQPGT